MPEGPEVETIRRGLAQGITGQVVKSVEVMWNRSFPSPSDVVAQIVVGARILQVTRRAKVLMIELDSGYTLMFHLKMTGQIVLLRADGERFAGGHPSQSMRNALPDSSTKVIFTFLSGDEMFFNDFRKFGWVKLVPTDEVRHDPLIAQLGPEVDAPAFTVTYLREVLIRRKGSPVKAVILDQSTASGIGNIYADESLHLACIHPARLSGSIDEDETKRLHQSIQVIMASGIAHGGTSFSRYVNALGGKGDYLDHARVFRREGQPCSKHPMQEIVKLRVAGRGTHICPICQPLPTVAAVDL